MNNFDNSLDAQLRAAAEHLKAGRKQEAREVLRDALALDRNNLKTWELLWRAAYSIEEEVSSLKHILAIDPRHSAAKKRFAELQPTGATKSKSQPVSNLGTAKRKSSRSNRQRASILLLLLGLLIAIVCVSVAGLALFRGGYFPFAVSSNLTATAIAENNASCQALIDRAIQASGSYCGSTGSNTACYGNNTLKAELLPNAAQRFSERGDTIGVDVLHRLSASPLNLGNGEWGIAVFKVIANLPRSLPGETVSMVVFGNATLDNTTTGNNKGLESFYFSSELGQIVCKKIPFDGLMVTSPKGSGIHFMVNGAELTLMGNAGIKAIKNGEMEVSVYDGSARIVANGQEQYFGAGQSSSVQLGGPNGTDSISGPSAPKPLTDEELTMGCTMTGNYCSASEITPVSEAQAQAQIQSQITSTPTIVPTSTITRTPSPTIPPTYTLVVLPSTTPSPKPTKSPTATKPPSPTPTLTKVITNTPTRTITPTFTSTPTLTPTDTPVVPAGSTCGNVSMSALTNPNTNELSTDITNSSGGTITINRFFAYWVKSPNSQKIIRLFLNGARIWNTSDPFPPSDFPAESPFADGAILTIPDATTSPFLLRFQDDLQPTGYEVHIYFDIGCQVTGTK